MEEELDSLGQKMVLSGVVGGGVGRRGLGTQHFAICCALPFPLVPHKTSRKTHVPSSQLLEVWEFNNCVLSSASRGAQAQTEWPRVTPLGSQV